MRTYYIARKGSNSANQSMLEWMILGCTQGKVNAEHITDIINENKTEFTVYANQKVYFLTKKEVLKYTGSAPPENWIKHSSIPNLLIEA